MQSHKDLIVWQRGIQIVKVVYLLSGKLPKSEAYGLSSQMRRAAVSIPSNIAEGYSRGHRPEYIQFLRVAFGSAAELETQLILVRELKLLAGDELVSAESQTQEILRMLNRLINSLSPKNR